MTFQEQVGWCRRWGALLVVLSISVPSVATFMGMTGPKPLILQILFFALMAPGLALLVFGGVMRPVQRAMWFRAAAPSSLTDYGRLVGRMPLGGIWRWWLHIDETGRNLDD